MEISDSPRLRQLQRWFYVSHWRYLYLCLAVVHFLIWRVSSAVAPEWDRYRIMGGLLPVEIIALRMVLELSIHPVWISLAAFAISFRFQWANAAPAVATACLISFMACACTLLLVLFAAMTR